MLGNSLRATLHSASSLLRDKPPRPSGEVLSLVAIVRDPASLVLKEPDATYVASLRKFKSMVAVFRNDDEVPGFHFYPEHAVILRSNIEHSASF